MYWWNRCRQLCNSIRDFFYTFVRFVFSHYRGLAGGVIVALVLVKVQEGSGSRDEIWFLLFWGIISALSVELLLGYADYIRHKELDDQYETLKKNVPPIFADYVSTRLLPSVQLAQQEVTDLQRQGIERTFTEKLSIITRLLPAANHGNKARYLATSLDSPSLMFGPQGKTFFIRQAECLGQIDKRRVIVIEPQPLSYELADQSKRSLIRDLILWHHKNKFELRFMIGSRSDFAAKASIPQGGAADKVLVDFAVMGDQWVFGEEANLPGNSPRTIRMVGTHGGVEEYARFFEDIWGYWDEYRWPVLSSRQVLSECERMDRKNKNSSRIATQYPQLVGLEGDQFFQAITAGISQARSQMIAVDIAPLKGDMNDWLTKNEYKAFLEASIQAASKGCLCQRIYVLNSPEIDDAKVAVWYREIFKRQIDAGVEVFMTCQQSLAEMGKPVHDFIIADDLCFSLGWNDLFNSALLGSSRNLEITEDAIWYRQLANNIIQRPLFDNSVKKLDGLSEDRIIEYFVNLRW